MKKFSTARVALVVLFVLAGMSIVGSGWTGAGTRLTGKTTTRVVEMELTFANGDIARVSQFDSVPFTIEDHGKLISLVPVVRDWKSNAIQLEISQPKGGEMRAIGNFTIGSEPTKISRAGGLTSIRVNGFSETAASPGGKGCCVTDCSGRKICDPLCVCTKCGACGPCLCVPFP